MNFILPDLVNNELYSTSRELCFFLIRMFSFLYFEEAEKTLAAASRQGPLVSLITGKFSHFLFADNNTVWSLFCIPHQKKYICEDNDLGSVRPCLRFVHPDEFLPTPMNIFFRYFTYAFTTILLWILWSFVTIKFKIADLSPLIFVCWIDKIFENFVRLDEYLPTPIYICLRYFTCINYNPHINPVKFCYDKIQNGRLIDIVACSNWQNIWKLCTSG